MPCAVNANWRIRSVFSPLGLRPLCIVIGVYIIGAADGCGLTHKQGIIRDKLIVGTFQSLQSESEALIILDFYE